MDKRVIDYLERRMRVSRDNEYHERSDRERDRDRRNADYDYDYDERRGVRGTGPYGMGGRRYTGNDRNDYNYDRDYARGDRDYRDGDYARNDRNYSRGGDYRDNDYAPHQEMRLTPEDMHKWKQKMWNEDGTRGEHFDIQQIMHVVEKLGVDMSKFSDKELCLTVNMLYSDYCKVVKKYLPIDKELMFYVDMASAFLKDKDGPKPTEKLALYYYCIVDNDEV